jgi:hypothetical protein
MSKLASTALLVLLAASTFAMPTAPAQAACIAVANFCPPPPPPPGGGNPNNPGNPGDPFIPPGPAVERQLNILIACRVSGTPDALPDDLKFRNIGDKTIPAATRVYWAVKETGEYGYFALPQDLPVGKSVPDNDVLKAGLPTQDHCLSKIV